MKTILVPLNIKLKESPDHLLFAARHLEEVAKTEFGEKVVVKYLYYEQKNYGKRELIRLNLKLMWKILTTKHDLLYFATDPLVLGGIAFLKILGGYRKPMYAWKYIALYKSKNPFVAKLKKKFYDAFDCIFMVTEKHVGESVSNGMIASARCKYVEWGEDVDYVDKIISPLSDGNITTFVSTGKAYRDFDTLCKAFEGVKNAKLKIFTVKGWGAENYQEVLSKYQQNNIEIYFVEDLQLGTYKNVLDYLLAELKAADCSVVICKKVNFGVGFTAILDAMVCGCSLIATAHPDNPIDIDECGIGETVPAENVSALHTIIEDFVNNKQKMKSYSNNARKMIENRYNIKRVAKRVLEVMLKE